MTGWRIGYCGGPKEIITAMTHHPGPVDLECLQHLAEGGGGGAQWRSAAASRDMNRAFKERHDFVVRALNSLPGVSCLPGAGTFYAFADVRGAMRNLGLPRRQRLRGAAAQQGRRRRGAPARASARPGHMRLSFACSMQTLEKAIERMRAVLPRNGPGQDGLSRPVRPVGSRGRRARTLARRHCGNYLFTNSGNRSSLAT